MGFIWGGINGLSGIPLEWLPFVGMGYFVGTSVRAAGKGVTLRFGVAGAVLTLFGCLISRVLAMSFAVGIQNPSLGNFTLFSRGDIDLWLRFLADSTDWIGIVSLVASVYQGYFLRFIASRHKRCLISPMKDHPDELVAIVGPDVRARTPLEPC
jgi:hypothetical protein